MFIFIDESGDLGLTRKHVLHGNSSSYYCLGVVAYKNDQKNIEAPSRINGLNKKVTVECAFKKFKKTSLKC